MQWLLQVLDDQPPCLSSRHLCMGFGSEPLAGAQHLTTMKGHTQLQQLRDPLRTINEEFGCLWRAHLTGGVRKENEPVVEVRTGDH